MGSARTVEVRQIEQPEDLPGKVIAEVSSDGITPESTAELEIGLELEGEPTELYFGNTTPRNCRNGAVNRTTGWFCPPVITPTSGKTTSQNAGGRIWLGTTTSDIRSVYS